MLFIFRLKMLARMRVRDHITARGENLHLLHDAVGVGNSCTNFFHMTWHDMSHAKRAGDQISFRSKIIFALIWVAICFVLEKCYDWGNLASILFEIGFFFWRNSILPTFGFHFLSSHAVPVLSMQMVKNSKSFASHFSHKQHREQESL